jgi:hypothetical protein
MEKKTLPFFYQFMVPDLLRENLRNKMWDVQIWARLHALMHKKLGCLQGENDEDNTPVP